MRRLLFALIIGLLVLPNIYSVYAETNTEARDLTVLTIGRLSNRENFLIDSSGIGNCTTEITFSNTSDVDSVKVSITVTKDNSTATVYSISNKKMTKSSLKKYTFSDEFKINTRCTYKMQVYYMCYNGSQLLEALIAEPKTVTY